MKCLGVGASRLVVSSIATVALGCNAIFGISEGKPAGDGGGAQGGEAQGAGSSSGGGTTGGGSGTGGGGGTGGDGGGPPAGCDPNGPTAIDASCGLFVSPTGDPSADGETPATATTFAKALTSPPPNVRIYVCGGPYLDNVVVPGGVIIEGGLDCATWLRGTPADMTTIQALNMAPALAVTGPAPTTLNNLHLVGVTIDVSGGQMGSSIGAWFNNASVTVNDSLIEAKDAGSGVDGNQPGTPGANGAQGSDGLGSGTCVTTAALGGTSPCNTTGGAGAKCLSTGSAGEMGIGNIGSSGLGGSGGATCMPGGEGSVGEAGVNAMLGPDVGALFDFSYVPSAPSMPAGPGVAGGGGGGGGTRTSASSGGGGGGGGGCGGPGGTSGKGGGASFALVITNSDVTLNKVRLTAGVGGRGGKGGNGQVGGQGGPGGSAGSGACYGGGGGQGGYGGNGAGGAGGPAAAIAAAVGASVTVDPFTRDNAIKGVGGVGGTGGNIGPVMGLTGQQGQRCARLVFQAGDMFNCDPTL